MTYDEAIGELRGHPERRASRATWGRHALTAADVGVAPLDPDDLCATDWYVYDQAE